jgi:drug/metabolite transporter (DMT)-like permease
MPSYFFGIIAAFSEPVLHAYANILDNYLADKLFARLAPLVFFGTIFELLTVPVIWYLDPPSATPVVLLGILFVVSIIEVSYLFPYYWSLRRADTSVVASLFSLGKIFIPLLAFYFVGERLTLPQYAGFLILILSSVLLTLDFRKMRLNVVFFIMLGTSLALSLQAILLKYVYEQGMGWGTSVIWTCSFQFFMGLALMVWPANRAELRSSISRAKQVGLVVFGMEAFSVGGSLGSMLALYFIPISIAKAIAATQPIFVLVYALLFSKKYPHLFREYIGRDGVAKKSLLFVCIIAGTLLIVF